ncbi:hypothetical protein ANO11243_080720 [Dothideomycetidae sp. 11243]|nr:hypothetical protein ANO11243_080720 [fungal sp. No.11243]
MTDYLPHPDTPSPHKAAGRIGKKKRELHPIYTAKVDRTAGDAASEDLHSPEHAIFERIRKCLDRSNHASCSPREQQAALLLARRLMCAHNIEEAEVRAEEEATAVVAAPAGGESVVSVRHTFPEPTKVQHQKYVNCLLNAMRLFFHCKSFTTGYRDRVQVTFYGMAQHTVIAAMAFETVFNLINKWALAYKGGNPRTSYLLGITWGLMDVGEEERTLEELRARRVEAETAAKRLEQERTEEQARLSRLAPRPETPMPDFDEPMTDFGGNDSSPSSADEALDSSDTEIYQGPADASDGEEDDHSHPIGGCFDDDEDFMDITEPDFEGGDDFTTAEGSMDADVYVDKEIDRLIKSDTGDKWYRGLGGGTTRETAIVLTDDEEDDNVTVKAAPGITSDDLALGHSTPKIKAESEVDERAASLEAEAEALIEQATYKTHNALILARKDEEAIADEWIKQKGLKMRKGRRFTAKARDHVSYRQGKIDARKINVRSATGARSGDKLTDGSASSIET